MNGPNTLRNVRTFVALITIWFDIANCMTDQAAHEPEDVVPGTTEAHLADLPITTGGNSTDPADEWIPPERFKTWFPIYRLGVDNGVPCTLFVEIQFSSLSFGIQNL